MNTKYKAKKNILPLLAINIFSFFIGHLSNSPVQDKSISLPSDLGSKNIQLNVKIDLIENLGFEKIIYAKLSNTQVIIKSSEDTINQPLKISFSKDKVLFFDKNKNRIR